MSGVLESLIGPGDSGGPVLVEINGTYALAGVSTFFEGYGGRFGDIGGGIVLNPYLGWITETTGLAVPEPGTFWLVLVSILNAQAWRWARARLLRRSSTTERSA